MKLEQLFIFIFLMGAGVSSAQSRSDFDIMLANSIEKLYWDPDAAIKACKNISLREDQLAEKMKVKRIMAEAYSLKGNAVDAVKMALENVNASEDLHTQDRLAVNLGVVQCFQEVNLHEQSEILLAPVLKELSKLKNNRSNGAAKAYQLHAVNILALGKYDGALQKLQRSAALIEPNSAVAYLLFCTNKILTANIFIQKKELPNAEKAVKQVIDVLKTHPQNHYLLSLTNLTQAEVLFAKKEHRSAIETLQEALEKLGNADFLILKNEIDAALAKNYLALKENAQHRSFLQKYERSQTVIAENRNEAIRNIMKLNQSFQTQQYKTSVSEKQQQNDVLLGIVVLIIGTFLFLNFQENQKSKALAKQFLFFENQRKRFEKYENTEKEVEKNILKKPLVIPKEKEDRLLQKLQEFEETTAFLSKNMSLALLAAQLETNTKYLSEVINKYKGKNFTTYINELKINHIAHLLSSDLLYLQYKISYLAEIAGFTSHSTFTVVFKSVTGMSPNEYIQQVKKRAVK